MASRPLPDFAPLLAGIARELRARRLPFMFVGGQAVLLHGAPRLTTDIDLTLGVGPQDIASVEAVCRRLELASLVPEPASFAAETFVWPTRQAASAWTSSSPTQPTSGPRLPAPLTSNWPAQACRSPRRRI